MANDTPFTDLPKPPRSPSQDTKSRDIRGDDFGPTVTDDDSARARAYAAHILAMAENVRKRALAMKGSPTAYKSLLHKTMPLMKELPPYIESEL